MTREQMIQELLKIYNSIPREASGYHIIDILLGAAERRGMNPPYFSIENATEPSICSADDHIIKFYWEKDENERRRKYLR